MPKAARGKRAVVVPDRKWALEQIAKEHKGFHPLVEMVRIAQAPSYTKHTRERFGYLVEIAKFIVPKPRPLEILVGENGESAGEGKVTIEWKR